MFTKQNFKFSDSLVLKELQRIGRERKLITEDDELFVPELKKKASSTLTQTGNIVLDAIVLADALRRRGYVKQAEKLIEKALILKKAMSDGGYETLYDFWSETGEALVNEAHKQKNDVAGHKVPDLNEMQKEIHNIISKDPTGNLDKAAKMAMMFEMVVKEAYDQGNNKNDKSLSAKIYALYSKNPVWTLNQPQYVETELMQRMIKGISSKIISNNLTNLFKIDLENLDETIINLNNFITSYSTTDKYKSVIEPAKSVMTKIQELGSNKGLIDIIMSGDISRVKSQMDSDNDDAEDWGANIKAFARFYTYQAVQRKQSVSGLRGEWDLFSPWDKNDLQQIKSADDLIAKKAESNDWIVYGPSNIMSTFKSNFEEIKNTVPSSISSDILIFSKDLINFGTDLKFVKDMKGLAATSKNLLLKIAALGKTLNIPKANKTAMDNMVDINKILALDETTLKASILTLSTINGLDKSPEQAYQKMNNFVSTFQSTLTKLQEIEKKQKKEKPVGE